MKTTSITQILALSAFCLSSTSAWPVLLPGLHFGKRDPMPQPQPQAPGYSVVAVDGGSSGAPAPTKTVTNAVTEIRTSVITNFATIVVTESNSAQTSVVPQTITVTNSVLQNAASVTSVPYDNGMWHTTYYYASTINASPVPSSGADLRVAAVASTNGAASASPTPSTTKGPALDPGQWESWSEQNNGLWKPGR